MEKHMGWNVWVMEPDWHAGLLMAGLLQRDCRVKDCQFFASPQGLQDAISRRPSRVEKDLIFIAAEYHPHVPDLELLLLALRFALPNALILCLANQPAPDLAMAALRGGAQGLLLKSEAAFGLLTAALRAVHGQFLHTPGLARCMPARGQLRDVQVRTVPAWKSQLSPRLSQAFELRVVQGMQARTAARRMVVQTCAVEKYVSDAYRKLDFCPGVDTHDFEGICTEKLSKEERGLLFYTGLPRLEQAPRRIKVQPGRSSLNGGYER